MTDPLARLAAEETRLLTELAEVRGAMATLRRLCGLTDPPHGPLVTAEPAPAPAPQEPTPGKGEARPSPAGASPGNRRGPKPNPGRPRAILRALLAGPKTSGEILTATGMSAATFCRQLREGEGRGWWVKPGNKMSPWELTPEGRAAAEAAG